MAIKKYGIIAGNAEIMEIRKMGVDDPNIWNVANRLRLIEQLRQGDSLCVVRLSSMCTGARDVYNMLDCLVRKRVCFQSQNERYLNFSNKSPLNRTRQQFLYTMALRELWWMKTIYHLNAKPQVKDYLSRLIQNEYLWFIIVTFQNEGIKKQGN